jgi:hypothetical protein
MWYVYEMSRVNRVPIHESWPVQTPARLNESAHSALLMELRLLVAFDGSTMEAAGA